MGKPSPDNNPPADHSEMEHLKASSRYLRGTIAESLANPLTGSVAEGDAALLKFHGSYQQDDRDLRNERARQKLEPAYEFLIRIRAAGGIVTPQQWLALDQLAHRYANGSLRLTTRQSFQFHGVLKWNLKQTIAAINETLLTTIAACGDVNRNVMCNPNPDQSEIHAEVYDWAARLSRDLEPRTTAYHEIWLDGDKVSDSRADEEPLYGTTYLPRKFKIALAVPPSNDVDVLAHDLGLIAIVDDGRLAGFNVSVGGGMGMTHGETATYPNLAWVIGFCRPKQSLEVARAVIAVQRDYGDRANRKHARLKYTIGDRGLEWFKDELQGRLGWNLEAVRPYHFDHNGDRYGWTHGTEGRWHLTLFVENGRVVDREHYPLMTGLRKIAEVHQGDFRLTPNQNLIVGNIPPEKKPEIEDLVRQHRLVDGTHVSPQRRNSMACVALPTCGLAMAESERYLPTLVTKLEELLRELGLQDEEITIRMSGCPNGCSRPYVAEIAFVGKAVGKYNVYLGGSFSGERLGKLYRENIGEDDILEALHPLFQRFANERQPGEHFGDFVIREKIVAAVGSGKDFHD